MKYHYAYAEGAQTSAGTNALTNTRSPSAPAVIQETDTHMTTIELPSITRTSAAGKTVNAHCTDAADREPAGDHTGCENHSSGVPGGFLRDPILGVLAEVVADLEAVRIANTNRLRILTRTEPDADGENRGFGLTLEHPEIARLARTVDSLHAAEVDAVKNLEKAMRAHPLGDWVRRTKGIGAKQAARLLAAIGDPYWHDMDNRPRTVSELWAYAGYHVMTSGGGRVVPDSQMSCAAAGSDVHPDGRQILANHGYDAVGVAPKRVRGQKINWSTDARMRAYLIAAQTVKTGGPYREIYDDGRAKYADAVHKTECVRCGPKGKPAQVGSPLNKGHQHARALRLVAKEVLKDMWREARTIHEAAT
jgi:hypothetical protein